MSEKNSKSQSFNNPFPGLRAFKDSENHLFFGREEHIDDVLLKLDKNHFVAVVGTSGTGKSSLIKAGVLPALKGDKVSTVTEKWEVVSMNPGSSPFLNLAEAICSNTTIVAKEDKESFKDRLLGLMKNSTLGLVQAMRPVLDVNSKLLILVDQFEEVFRFSDEEEADAKKVYDQFVNLIIETVRQRDVPIYAILTLRSDFLGDCVAFEGLPEAINDGHYLVPRMNAAQMKRAITGPIDYADGKISPRLIQHITLDLGSNPDQLPVLQHAMMRCWDYWKNNEVAGQPMDLKHFEAIGDLENALSNDADEAFQELNGAQQVLVEKIFKALTTKKADNRGVRRPMNLRSLKNVTEASQSEILECLRPFQKAGRSFILPGLDGEISDFTIFDISHESLMRGWNRLKAWVDEEMESAELYIRVCTAALLHQQGAAGLWRDPELQLAIDWKAQQKPISAWAELYNNDFEAGIQFIEESKDAAFAEKKKKRSRTQLIRISVSAFIIVISILAGWALVQTNVAEQKSAEAEQKSEEAIAQKKVAEGAKEEAQLASTEAEKSSELAKEQAKIASEQARIAEEQKQIAEQEKGKAQNSANIAISKQALADQKSAEALKQKEMADAASAEANRLRMVATSQNLAYSSAQVSQNPELAALLAIESYNIAKANGGNANSASLYNAALKALEQVVSDYSPKVISLNTEAIALKARKDALSVVDKEGNVLVFSPTDYGLISNKSAGLNTADINTAYINPLKNEFLFGLNTFNIYAIEGDQTKTLSGQSGLVRAIAFRFVNPTVISGGRDSKLILWNRDGSKQERHFEARIKTISALPNAPTAFVGCENGSVYRVGLFDKSLSVFASKNSTRVEAVSQTEDGNQVAIGYSDGTVHVHAKNGTLLKAFSGMGSVVAMQMNKASDVLVVAYSGRLLRFYALSGLTKLPIEVKTERLIKELDFNTLSGDVLIYTTDRAIQKYPIHAEWYIKQLQNNVTRKLSEEEWKTFVGSDIPFNATEVTK